MCRKETSCIGKTLDRNIIGFKSIINQHIKKSKTADST